MESLLTWCPVSAESWESTYPPLLATVRCCVPLAVSCRMQISTASLARKGTTRPAYTASIDPQVGTCSHLGGYVYL